MSFTFTCSYKFFQAIILCNLKEKLLNQTWENGKKLISGPILARLA